MLKIADLLTFMFKLVKYARDLDLYWHEKTPEPVWTG